ncbi:MAG: phage tail protein [Pseudomonadota bacterium]
MNSAFQFTLSIEGDTGVASFLDVSGLSSEDEIEDIRQGGSVVYRLPKAPKPHKVTFKRGQVPAEGALMQWCHATLENDLSQPIMPKTMSVELLDADGKTTIGWTLVNAYPIKLELGAWDTSGDSNAIETLVFAYQDIKRVI